MHCIRAQCLKSMQRPLKRDAKYTIKMSVYCDIAYACMPQYHIYNLLCVCLRAESHCINWSLTTCLSTFPDELVGSALYCATMTRGSMKAERPLVLHMLITFSELKISLSLEGGTKVSEQPSAALPLQSADGRTSPPLHSTFACRTTIAQTCTPLPNHIKHIVYANFGVPVYHLTYHCVDSERHK